MNSWSKRELELEKAQRRGDLEYGARKFNTARIPELQKKLADRAKKRCTKRPAWQTIA